MGQAASAAIHQRGGGPLLPLPPPGAEANGPEEEEGEGGEGDGGGGGRAGAGGCEVKNKDKNTFKTEIFLMVAQKELHLWKINICKQPYYQH